MLWGKERGLVTGVCVVVILRTCSFWGEGVGEVPIIRFIEYTTVKDVVKGNIVNTHLLKMRDVANNKVNTQPWR